jgi:aminopeptidase-like protein
MKKKCAVFTIAHHKIYNRDELLNYFHNIPNHPELIPNEHKIQLDI